jgi:hypothetical protein
VVIAGADYVAMEMVVGLVAGATLVAAWLVVTVRHASRRSTTAAEWDGADTKPQLWTSSARCLDCGSYGGLLRVEADDLEFECLTCGARRARAERG